nr:endonuclease/exonuclease/phosphatase family protein [Minwuia thermotolerans]
MRVATYNLQNLRLRRREGRLLLDGAVDHDDRDRSRRVDLDIADRKETARVIKSAQAEVVALQEVFDLAALDFFHDAFLLEAGPPVYPFRYYHAGNDGHGRNIAALCRHQPRAVISHADLTGTDLGVAGSPEALPDGRLFRRDCLELDFDAVALFVCHFKAPYPDPEKAHAVRETEARAVRHIIETRFTAPENERWIVLGDFNEPAFEPEFSRSALHPLGKGFSVDLMDRMTPGMDWTYEMPGTHLHTRPDRILVSPRLAAEYPDVRPEIVRTGMGSSVAGGASDGSAPQHRGHASDHALVYAEFPGL